METIGPLLFWALVIALYFLPAWLAYNNHKKQADSIALLNLLLGWTVVGWVASIVWATARD